jgi:hypothetical protein
MKSLPQRRRSATSCAHADREIECSFVSPKSGVDPGHLVAQMFVTSAIICDGAPNSSVDLVSIAGSQDFAREVGVVGHEDDSGRGDEAAAGAGAGRAMRVTVDGRFLAVRHRAALPVVRTTELRSLFICGREFARDLFGDDPESWNARRNLKRRSRFGQTAIVPRLDLSMFWRTTGSHRV